MENENIIELEKHDTKDITDKHVNGSLTVIWRNWDKKIKNNPEQVYVSSVNPGEIKGPHLHTKRNTYFTCIHGKILLIIKKESGEFEEIFCSGDEPKMVLVPRNIASAHINISDDISRILVLADVAWKPNDNEMKDIQFENYDWKKWNVKN